MTDSKVSGHIAYELDAKAEDLPDFKVVAFEQGDFSVEALTYQNIVINGRKIVKELEKAGIGKGDTFALLMRNHPEFVYSLYAGAAIGAVMTPIDPRIKAERLKFVLKDSRSKGIIFTSELMGSVEEALRGLPEINVIGVAHKDGMDVSVVDKYPNLNEILSGPEVPPPDQRNDDLNTPLEIIYTSGTTGVPKGVFIKSTRIATYSQMAKFVWQYNQDDKLYTGLSLTHANAQGVTLFPSLLLSIPSIISRKFTRSRIWDICRKYGCTTFSLLGGMMMGIYSVPKRPDDADNPVRLLLSAGTPRGLLEDFEKRFNVRIHDWYAALEGGFAHKPPGVGPIGSFGKPLEGMMEMKVVREDDTECESGEIGEIVSRLMGQETEVEYVGNKGASHEKTRGGWLRSGDMGHVDEDGWFFFDYRKGGGLRRSGDFIQPESVEAAIAEHPDVTDVCVYGIPAASGAPGESDVVAAVVTVAGAEADPQSIFQICKDKLEGNAVPSYLQVVEEIPKTASEKNLDRRLKDEFRKDAQNVFVFKNVK